jgi:hypothetical protein
LDGPADGNVEGSLDLDGTEDGINDGSIDLDGLNEGKVNGSLDSDGTADGTDDGSRFFVAPGNCNNHPAQAAGMGACNSTEGGPEGNDFCRIFRSCFFATLHSFRLSYGIFDTSQQSTSATSTSTCHNGPTSEDPPGSHFNAHTASFHGFAVTSNKEEEGKGLLAAASKDDDVHQLLRTSLASLNKLDSWI